MALTAGALDGSVGGLVGADPYHPKAVDDLAPYSVDDLAVHPSGTLLAVARGSSFELWDLDAPVTTRTLAVRSSPTARSPRSAPTVAP